MAAFDFSFNGKKFTWHSGRGKTYNATSGLQSWQNSKFEMEPDKGPTPTGTYRVPIFANGSAKDDGTGSCALMPAAGLQDVPGSGAVAASDGTDCWDNYWVNWGPHRLQFYAQKGAYNAAPKRGGFYIHDSGKGYSHGCIEVQASFFPELIAYIRKKPKLHHLTLSVDYASANMITNGDTGSAWTSAMEEAEQIRRGR